MLGVAASLFYASIYYLIYIQYHYHRLPHKEVLLIHLTYLCEGIFSPFSDKTKKSNEKEIKYKLRCVTVAHKKIYSK